MIRRTLWVIATALLTAAKPPAATPLDIQSVELWTGDEAGKDWRRVPDGKVFVRGKGKTCLGWMIRHRPAKRLIEIEEYVWFPAPVKVNRLPGARIGSNGRFLMTFMRFPGARGIIGRSVCLTSDDPLGAYKIVVSHGKPVIGRVHFILLDRPLERTDVTIPLAEADAIRAMLE
jgi:hypothetical protein